MAMKMVRIKRLRLSHKGRDPAIVNANHSHYHRATLRVTPWLRKFCMWGAPVLAGCGGSAPKAAMIAALRARGLSLDDGYN
jgi:hypothetical protein